MGEAVGELTVRWQVGDDVAAVGGGRRRRRRSVRRRRCRGGRGDAAGHPGSLARWGGFVDGTTVGKGGMGSGVE
jgi:hypothetical protein